MKIIGIRNKNVLLVPLVFGISFSVYFITLCPTVYTGDSGELITAAYVLGVPHSPGYPLYCLLGRLFTFIPLGSIAFRVNLMSAFFAALACVVIYFLIFKIINLIKPDSLFLPKFLSSLSASLIYGFSRTFWSQAVIAEVYTLWIFVLALTFLVLIIWIEKKSPAWLYLFSFLYGLSITTHQVSLFFAPGFFMLILLYRPKVIVSLKVILFMLVFSILGLSLYLYVPLRAMANPAINWNKIHNLNGFIGYLLRQQYGDVKSTFNSGYFTGALGFDLKKAVSFLRFLTFEFGYAIVISLFGFILLSARAKRMFLVLFTLFAFSGWSIWRRIVPIERELYAGSVFLLAGHAATAIFIGLGLMYLLELSSRKARRPLYIALIFAVLFLPVNVLIANYFLNDQSRNFIAYNYGRNILDTLDKNAFLFAHGDNTIFILAYLKLAEKLRTDVTVYDDISGDIFKETPVDFALYAPQRQDEIIDTMLKKTMRPLYISFGNSLAAVDTHNKELTGIVYKLLRPGEKVDSGLKDKYWNGYRLEGVFDEYLENKDYLMREILAGYHIALGARFFSKNEQMEAIALYHKAGVLGGNIKLIQETLAMHYSLIGLHQEALTALKKAVEIDPQDPEIYYNLGVAYAKSSRYNEAITSWESVLKIDPDFENTRNYINRAKEIVKAMSEK